MHGSTKLKCNNKASGIKLVYLYSTEMSPVFEHLSPSLLGQFQVSFSSVTKLQIPSYWQSHVTTPGDFTAHRPNVGAVKQLLIPPTQYSCLIVSGFCLSSTILRSLDLYYVTAVSGPPIAQIFKFTATIWRPGIWIPSGSRVFFVIKLRQSVSGILSGSCSDDIEVCIRR